MLDEPLVVRFGVYLEVVDDLSLDVVGGLTEVAAVL
jgi:hypothetical protein